VPAVHGAAHSLLLGESEDLGHSAEEAIDRLAWVAHSSQEAALAHQVENDLHLRPAVDTEAVEAARGHNRQVRHALPGGESHLVPCLAG